MLAIPIPTEQANYNFTHALYHTCESCVFQHGERNNHACKLKFTRLAKPRVIPTWVGFMRVPHILSLVGV